MFVLDEGSGPAVVLVPILGADHRMYAPQVEALRDEFRCLAVDLRGCGASPTLDGVPEHEVLRVQAREIVEALDERGIAAAHLVGISYGGVVVETLMLEHGERVASAVICDSLCDMRPRSLPERLLMASAKVQPLLYRLPPRWLSALEQRVYRRWPEAGQAVADALLNSRRDDLVKQRRAVNAIRLEDRLRRCATPTLCVAGASMPTGVEMMRRVHEALPESEFTLIEDSVDPSNLCQPEVFTKTVADWVRRVHAPSSPQARNGDLPR
ncbi:alpha/beta fold hydrolase [Qaidamihabitans albus]|uniref:alpha/beta fold hydrolase n=1 Tax=Qaidamihabitans albus TaxID=2795733 RepID=UPI0018F131A4|nr:alpha/beta hydrolase [Qaidamihabitans albus]